MKKFVATALLPALAVAQNLAREAGEADRALPGGGVDYLARVLAKDFTERPGTRSINLVRIRINQCKTWSDANQPMQLTRIG